MQTSARPVWRRTIGRLIILFVAAGLGSVCVARSEPETDHDLPRAVTPRGPLSADELRNIRVFEAASPSVVHINTLADTRRPFSRRITQTPHESGTGFVWDEQGHIVTNFHVIEGASQVRVTLPGQSEWDASVVGFFVARDLAVLKLRSRDVSLSPLALGTSADLQVGQHVYAIGNPFGLDQTMTKGIVSALEREFVSENNRTIRGAIQTDAAINPGNSGGPLLDSAGRLVGVNTAIISPSGSSVGIGFAIPVDEVKRIVPRLIRDGRFERPVIGIEPAPPRFLRALNLSSGVAILGVLRDGPADRAGLRPFLRNADGRVLAGDVIIEAGNQTVDSLDDLYSVLEQYEAGDVITIRLRRGRSERTEQIVLARSQSR